MPHRAPVTIIFQYAISINSNAILAKIGVYRPEVAQFVMSIKASKAAAVVCTSQSECGSLLMTRRHVVLCALVILLAVFLPLMPIHTIGRHTTTSYLTLHRKAHVASTFPTSGPHFDSASAPELSAASTIPLVIVLLALVSPLAVHRGSGTPAVAALLLALVATSALASPDGRVRAGRPRPAPAQRRPIRNVASGPNHAQGQKPGPAIKPLFAIIQEAVRRPGVYRGISERNLVQVNDCDINQKYGTVVQRGAGNRGFLTSGVGVYSEVWEALNRRTNGTAAIKIIRKQQVPHDLNRRRYLIAEFDSITHLVKSGFI